MIWGDSLRLTLRFILSCIFAVCFSSCNDQVSSTASYIQVIGKETGERGSSTITVKNPYDKNAKPFEITIADEMLWNLIEVDRIYFSSYETYGNGDVKLEMIKYPDDASPKK